MKRLLLVISLLFSALGLAQTTPSNTTHPPNTTVVAYDNFNRVNNATSMGANWTPEAGSVWGITSGEAAVPGTYPGSCPSITDPNYPGNWCINVYTGASFANDQYISAKVASWNGGDYGQAFGVRYNYYGTAPGPTGNQQYSGLYLSCGANSGSNCTYWILSAGPEIEGGVDNQINQWSATAGPSDTVSLLVVGYVASMYINGSQVGSSYAVNPAMFSFHAGSTNYGTIITASGSPAIQFFEGVPNTTYGFTYFEAGNAVEANLSSSPSSIQPGQSSTLTWSSQGASSCTGTNFTATGSATSGTVMVNPTVTTTYTVTCGSAVASATVTVQGMNAFWFSATNIEHFDATDVKISSATPQANELNDESQHRRNIERFKSLVATGYDVLP